MAPDEFPTWLTTRGVLSDLRSVEVTRIGNLSVADQLVDIRRWCAREGIRVADLHAVRILAGRVTFSATFERAADADRFVKRFSDPG